MVESVRDVLTSQSGRTALATVAGYLVILVLMTIVLFGGAYAFFSILG